MFKAIAVFITSITSIIGLVASKAQYTSLDAYLCDDGYNKITNPSFLTQGDTIELCTSIQADYISEYQISSIKNLAVFHASGHHFTYIDDFILESSELIKTICSTDSRICRSKIQLVAFHFRGGNIQLDINGSAKIHNAKLGHYQEAPFHLHMNMQTEGTSLSFSSGIARGRILQEAESVPSTFEVSLRLESNRQGESNSPNPHSFASLVSTGALTAGGVMYAAMTW